MCEKENEQLLIFFLNFLGIVGFICLVFLDILVIFRLEYEDENEFLVLIWYCWDVWLDVDCVVQRLDYGQLMEFGCLRIDCVGYIFCEFIIYEYELNCCNGQYNRGYWIIIRILLKEVKFKFLDGFFCDRIFVLIFDFVDFDGNFVVLKD